MLGGTLSVLVKLILYYVAVDQALRMLNLNGPEVNSQEVVFASQEKIYLNTTSKTLIEIWQGDGDPVPLTAETRKYMHASLKQYTIKYDDKGIESTTVKKAKLVECPESFFKTDYEKKFYKTYKDKALHCVDPNSEINFYLQGTRDSKVH